MFSKPIYQVSSIAENPNGGIDVEAVHFPTDDTSASLVTADVLETNAEERPDGAIIGNLRIEQNQFQYAAGETITFTAITDGDATDLTYT